MNYQTNRYKCTTICFDIRKYRYNEKLSSYISKHIKQGDEELFSYIQYSFIEKYTEKLMKKLKKYSWVLGYSYEGRSSGWLCIELYGHNVFIVKEKQIQKIINLVELFYKNFDNKFLNYLKRRAKRCY